jgi:2-dehydropantoate 2-reductase
MRILVVGAGAVGQVYGCTLQAGGAAVAVFVRDKHAEQAARGYDLTKIPLFGRRIAQRFVPTDVVTSPEEVAETRFDQVWLCVPTDALAGAWLGELLAATGDATIVCLQPGLEVKTRLLALAAETRIVFGVIGMMAFAAPMEGSDDPRETATPPSVAYLLPRGNPTRISGTSERRALAVQSALRAGGAPVALARDASRDLVFGSALLLPQVAALEIAGWSFREYRESNAVELGAAATREAVRIASALAGVDPPAASYFVLPPLLRLGSRLARLAAPLDVESFLRVHFTKVGSQTRLLLEEWRNAAKRLDLAHEGIDALLEELDGAHAQS